MIRKPRSKVAVDPRTHDATVIFLIARGKSQIEIAAREFYAKAGNVFALVITLAISNKNTREPYICVSSTKKKKTPLKTSSILVVSLCKQNLIRCDDR